MSIHQVSNLLHTADGISVIRFLFQ